MSARTKCSRCIARCSASGSSRPRSATSRSPTSFPASCTSRSAKRRRATGVCAALRKTDRITSTHRGHGHLIAKGGQLNRMMAELYGKRTGYCKGKGGSMHIVDFALGILGANGIVGGGMPIATGSALAALIAGQRRRHRMLLRRRRIQRGHLPRIAQHRGGLETAGGLRLREQRLRRIHPDADRDLGAATSRSARRPTTSPGISSTATT